jgi:2,4-didehydro-3-deoxy-L-rhamnonate hydrolase
MKLMRYGPKGNEKPALVDAQGKVRDLSKVLPDIVCETLTPSGLKRLRELNVQNLPVVANPGRTAPPWTGCGKFIAVGLNYADHAAESGLPIPKEPVLFTKPTSCIVGCNDAIVLPKGSVKGDWEIELGIVIGSKARYVSQADAIKHVAGYCVINDVSERQYQIERGGGQWDKGKGCDTFGPIGPWLVTTDEITDPQNLSMELDLNGKRQQTGNTKTMIFGVAHLVSYISEFMTLYPGDVITTGTPPGVGLGMKPPMFLKAGDTMRVAIQGLGEQNQKVHAWSAELIDG